MTTRRDGCACQATGAEVCRLCPHPATGHARYRRGTKHVVAGACTNPGCGCGGYERQALCSNERGSATASAEPRDAQAPTFYAAGDPPPIKVGTQVVGVPSIYPWRVTHVAEDGTVTISPEVTE